MYNNAVQGLNVQCGFEARTHNSQFFQASARNTHIRQKTSMNIMKGEVEVPVLNNAHVTYFYYPADSTSFIQAGKDPVVLGLSTLHLSCSIFNCFLLLRECLFYVRCSICHEARWRSSVRFLPRKSCHVQWKKTTLMKHIILAFFFFYEAVLCQTNHPFPRFPPGPRCCPVWTMSVLC